MKIKLKLFIFFITFIIGTYNFSINAETKLKKISKNFSHPWGMSFVNDDELIVTERRGKIFRVNWKSGKRVEIANVPSVLNKYQGGLLDIIVNGYNGNIIDLYYCFSKPIKNGSATAVNRAYLKKDKLFDQKTIFISNFISHVPLHFGCRLIINKKHIYITLGERNERFNAQNGKLHSGSVVRLSLDGSVPKDNPRLDNWAPENFTIGHRNPQGIAINYKTNEIWINEHGPRGGDEINILKSGSNYGWPIVTFGKEYSGGKIGDGVTSLKGFEDSIWYWSPSIAPSGMTFYQGNMFPEFKGNLLVSSLKFASIYNIALDSNRPISEKVLLQGKIGRIRDIEIASDGSIFILTDENNGGLYRMYR